jgi:hypothetical protein
MSYLLIAIVVVAALSPLISAMPSRRQRLIADLRQAAAVTGLFVRFRQSPLERDDAPPRVFYGRRRTREDAKVSGEILYRCDEGSWTAVKGQWPKALLDSLQALPGGVSLACEDLQGVGVFWNEEGQKEDVSSIDSVLKGMLARAD